jgi:hypothetical protein
MYARGARRVDAGEEEVSIMKRRLSFRVTLASVVVVILASAGTLAATVGGSAAPHAKTLTTVTIGPLSYPTKNLPPSHDNDAGRARSLDSTPDNDTDAWQRVTP